MIWRPMSLGQVYHLPYEIACYAMGPQEFRLSYEQLAPHLNSHGRDLLGIGKN